MSDQGEMDRLRARFSFEQRCHRLATEKQVVLENEIASLRADNTTLRNLHLSREADRASLQRKLESARKALEHIERSDRRWQSDYAVDETDIIERAVSGNVLVHGPEGRVARNALLSLTDEKGADKPTRQRLTFCDRCNSNQMHNFVAIVDGVSVFQCCGCALSSAKGISDV